MEKVNILQRDFGPLKQEHIFAIRQWRNEQMDILRQKTKLTRTGQVQWFKGLKKDKTQKLFAIYENAGKDSPIIGYCGLTNLDLDYSRAELSFIVATSRTRDLNVYSEDMISALAFLADLAFKTYQLKRIFTETYAFRGEHIKILERFGFKQEGTLRSHIFKKGRFHDSIMHSILKEEYHPRGRSSL